MTFCQPLPRSVAEEMLQVVARAICDRPGESPAQRESRTRQMVHSTMGFEPRDGLEYMLSTMTVGHFHLILDAMFDVFHGQAELLKARTRTTVVALDRSLLAFVKELRLTHQRPLARGAMAEAAAVDAAAAQEAGTDAAARDDANYPAGARASEARSQQPRPTMAGGASEKAGGSVTTPHVPDANVVGATMAVPPAATAEGSPRLGQTAAIRTGDPRAVGAGGTSPIAHGFGSNAAQLAASVSIPAAARAAAGSASPLAAGGTPVPARPDNRPKSLGAAPLGPRLVSPGDVSDDELARHIREFQQALATMTETLAEASDPKAVTSGD